MGPISASELVAELERRRREDPVHRAELERIEAETAERRRLLAIAEQALVEDLHAVGIDVSSIWDLHKVLDARPKAIPVLMEHLALDYPDRVLEGIGIGLDHRSVRAWWSSLREMMLTTDRDVVRD
ncbi:hypothetical protein [Aeromicrobium endophyticum]|uniref:Uncharacterized protein n=1 Tax=Aeromicrobium endophyticum TaxID=2292704 RepID=A0A371P819_9ACTN|nr:hypothetical protein [Aeromicrobium endophyticum]REK72124.1 hypothetical protein DX116_00265 [Aeromicrobium endophyticum]